eukprot:COSAG01_NODE_27852_length_675_cov_1.126736_2_plen_111_part_01
MKVASLSAGGDISLCCSACERTHGCAAFTFAPPSSYGPSDDTDEDCWLHAPGERGCTLHAAAGRVAGLFPSPPPALLRAHAFNLSAVRLVPDPANHFAAAQALNTQFLMYL